MANKEQEEFVDVGSDSEIFVPENAVDQITHLSKFCHGVVSQYGQAFGQDINEWNDLSKSEQQHYIARVAHFMAYPESTAGEPHEAWKMRLLLNGWSYGHELNADRKTRPELVFFSQLPPEQQAVDYIIKGIVHGAFQQE